MSSKEKKYEKFFKQKVTVEQVIDAAVMETLAMKEAGLEEAATVMPVVIAQILKRATRKE